MTQPTDWQLPMRPGNLETLDLRECVRLLASRPVGRLAYCGPFGPRIVPLNHTVVGEGLLFRTSPDSDAAREIPHHWVAFEVDDLDDFLQAGWSVQVRGSQSCSRSSRSACSTCPRRLSPGRRATAPSWSGSH